MAGEDGRLPLHVWGERRQRDALLRRAPQRLGFRELAASAPSIRRRAGAFEVREGTPADRPYHLGGHRRRGGVGAPLRHPNAGFAACAHALLALAETPTELIH